MSTNTQLRFLFCLRGDRTRASSRVRGYWIAEELERLGHQCTILGPTRRGNIVNYARELLRHDVVIFQKRSGRRDPLMVRMANVLRTRTFYDIDDLPRPHAEERTQHMMSLVDGVFAGSPGLAAYVRPGNARVRLLPSAVCIDNYRLVTPRGPSSVPCVGWIGNGKDYAQDLVTVLRPPLVSLAARRRLKLKIVGACGDERLHKAFEGVPGLETEVIDQIAWGDHAKVAAEISSFDIGVYPLLDTEFNRHKCGFKALEYMASGLPVIASPVGALSEMVSDDVGFASTGTSDWLAALEALTADPALRARLGRAGREKVERYYSTEAVARSLLETCRPGSPRPRGALSEITAGVAG